MDTPRRIAADPNHFVPKEIATMGKTTIEPGTDPQDPGQQAENNGQQAQAQEFTPPESQEAMDRIIESRLARERAKFEGFDELKAKAAKYDQAEDAKKTAEQKSAERIQTLEAELNGQKLAVARAEIARDRGLDPKLLAGNTEEELTAHADAIAAAFEAQAPAQHLPPRAPGEGRNQPPAGGDWLREAMQGN